MTRTRTFKALTTVGVCVLAAISLLFLMHERRRRAELAEELAHRTREELREAAIEIRLLADRRDPPIPKDAREIARWISAARGPEGALLLPYRIRAGRLWDPYANPVTFTWINARILEVRSLGANGQDDDGRGDDIAIWFEPTWEGAYWTTPPPGLTRREQATPAATRETRDNPPRQQADETFGPHQ